MQEQHITNMFLFYFVSHGSHPLLVRSKTYVDDGPIRFAEKTSQNIVLDDLLWEKNTVPAEKKTPWKVRITREANRADMYKNIQMR